MCSGLSREPLTWKQTLGRLRADYRRLGEMAGTHDLPPGGMITNPSFLCVFLYRLSNHSFRAGHRHIARFFWHLNMLITGADISPPVDLGEGLVIMTPAGTAIMGNAGRNLTVMACAGMGGEVGRHEDVGAGPGLPVLGDDVILEPHCGVLGPIRVGNRVRVGALTGLTQDVGDDMFVEGRRAQFLRRRDLP